MGNSVVAVIRLMTQPRQTLQICGNSMVRFSFHSQFDKRKVQKENFNIENWNYTLKSCPFDTKLFDAIWIVSNFIIIFQ